MKKAFLFAATSFLLLVTSCKTETKTKDKSPDEILNEVSKLKTINVGNDNYIVNIPTDWTTKDTTLNGVSFYFLLAPKTDNDFNTNMNILNESMQGESFDDYKKKSIETMKKQMPSLKFLDNGDIEASNINGSWLHYKMEQSGLKIEIISYTFPKDGIAYIITATTKEGELDKYRNTFDAVAKSFRFKN